MHGLRREFVFYLATSVVALALDMTLFLTLARSMHYMAAAAIGFLAGSVVHYLLAVRLVFAHRKLAHNTAAEGLIYIVIGLVGLAVNNGVIYACVSWLQAPLFIAKLAAATGSFLLGYVGRKLILFGAAAGKAVG
jgi:putative flippase GtrA